MDTFLKCDLHVHSSSCFSRSYDEATFLEAIKISGLDVISITDHNIIDVDLYKKIINDSSFKPKLIGGVELNISLDPDTIQKYNLQTHGDYFHSIMWFDNKNLDIAWNSLKELIGFVDKKLLSENSDDLKKISSGMDAKSFTLKSIQEKFTNIDYYFTFHENKGSRNLSDYLPNSDRKTGQQFISNQKFKESLFYYNNAMSIEGGEKSKPVKNFFEKNLDTLVAAFLFSDALTVEGIGNKFTWINFDGDFASLILPISDPKSRVFTSEKYPANPQKNLDNYLSGIKIRLQDFDGTEKEEEIRFSPGLNGIIGARGDGKSMLGNLIAKENASTYRDYVNYEDIVYVLPNGVSTTSKPKCKYLKQKDLFQIYENTEYNKLDLLRRYYDDLLKENNKVVDVALATIRASFIELKEMILEFHKKYLGQTYLFTPLQKEVSPNKLLANIDLDSMENSVEKLEDYKQFLEEKIQSWKCENEILQNKNVDSSYSELSSTMNKITEFKSVTVSNIDVLIHNAEDLLAEIEAKLPISKVRQNLIKLFHTSIDEINRGFDFSSTQLKSELDNLEGFFNDFLKARSRCYEIIKKIDNVYAGISSAIQSKKIQFEGNEITVAVERECKLSVEDILRLFIVKTSYTPDILVRLLLDAENFQSVSEHIKLPKFKNISNFDDFINSLFSQITEEVDEIQKATMHLYFNGTDVQKLSPGRRSEILLRILLDPSILGNDYMFIILDQPDDDLDTRTINELLVNKIKEMKLEMQFFVISHSAAVIINGDSDVIILAESETKDGKQKIMYTEGKINTLSMKEKIVTILDGGEMNLRARLHKYDFNYKEKANV
jgi:hypothetical protein